MSNNLTEEAQKRELRNRRHFSFRLNVFFFFTFFIFSLLIVRLAYLQFVEGDSLRAKEHEIGSKQVSVPPIRGNIYDSNGTPIAYSVSTQSLYYTLDMKMKEADGKALAASMVEIFDKYGAKNAKKLTAQDVFDDMDLNGSVHYSYQPRRIKSGLTKEEVAYFSEHRDQFKGIDVVEESIRQYSQDKVAVQLVGYMKKLSGASKLEKYKDINNEQTDSTLKYISTEEVGVDGLELMYQDELRGRNGVKEYPVNNQSEIIGPMKLTKPIKGENLYLTINKDIQIVAQQAIMDQLQLIRTSPSKQFENTKATTGYAVAMEVDTGKVVAMASMPDYDPSVWQGGISTKDLEQIQFFQYNGAIKEVYPPYPDDKERKNHPSSLVYLGSTQKPLSVLVGLNEKLFNTHTMFNDIGYFEFGKEGHKVRVSNASNAVNGPLNATSAIAKSSNAFMSAMVGNELYRKYKGNVEGVDVWDNYMKQFGLGVTTGSGLPSESAGVVDYYHEAEKASTQSALIRAAWGQQGRYTALQLAQYAATLASHGKRMRPQFVDVIKDVNDNVTQPYQAEVLNTVDFPDSYWNAIEAGMAQVKVTGFEGVQYTFLRKTGTSQQDVGNRPRVENAVFIAYAPAKNPKLAVAVVVPDGGYGGWGAAPIARKIFDAYDEKVGLTGTPRKPAAPVTNNTNMTTLQNQ
ncbi:peptidoglycan D,D-transpeptidase FtsI family protein [Cohnella silvisoli]|uniref:Penicillin-binding transpeptidase domain-containing protein n=1 Tax=Cohnella silvisoli TaxID=2873699 RepID=A0ABV1KXU5_9BACL|nr:penicillin-binding transpeptidase domain-containing protein [Cohnella silvisoli]MCD9023931.1 penicillin-binding protein 2 [Cohnella silvisoli]